MTSFNNIVWDHVAFLIYKHRYFLGNHCNRKHVLDETKGFENKLTNTASIYTDNRGEPACGARGVPQAATRI